MSETPQSGTMPLFSIESWEGPVTRVMVVAAMDENGARTLGRCDGFAAVDRVGTAIGEAEPRILYEYVVDARSYSE